MKLLVLGNGFDIDHNLPTSYYDFLNFCCCIVQNASLYGFKPLKQTQEEYFKVLENDNELKEKFANLIEDNNLFHYFFMKESILSNGWVDFEKELNYITGEFKAIEKQLNETSNDYYTADGNHRIHNLIEWLDINKKYNIHSGKISKNSLEVIGGLLHKSLVDFSLALELYISTFINTTEINGISPNIVDFNANKILTFNYSNTYERVYGDTHWNEDIEYIHGKADSYTEKSNIVLGITSNTDLNDKNISFIEFEKYYQKIMRGIQNNYKKWISKDLSKDEKIEVMFFGHSLCESDRDVILDVLNLEHSIIKVCYFNQESLQQIVKNLTEIIGKNKLTEYIWSDNPKLKFLKQDLHINSHDAGIDIMRDLHKLWQVHTLKQTDFDQLLDKIMLKINTSDLNYFYSQHNAISMYDVLMNYDIMNFNTKSFFEICKQLKFEIKYNRPVLHKYEEWNDYSEYDGVIECSKKTKTLIDKINEHNKKIFRETQHLNPVLHVLTNSSPNEYSKTLLGILNNPDPSSLYWKHIEEAVYYMGENQGLDKAVNELKESNLSQLLRLKFNHFLDIYYENQRDIYMQKQYEENEKNCAEDNC